MEIKRNGSPAVIDLTGKDYRLIIPPNEAPSEEGGALRPATVRVDIYEELNRNE